jgi:hypothetical protein
MIWKCSPGGEWWKGEEERNRNKQISPEASGLWLHRSCPCVCTLPKAQSLANDGEASLQVVVMNRNEDGGVVLSYTWCTAC